MGMIGQQAPGAGVVWVGRGRQALRLMGAAGAVLAAVAVWVVAEVAFGLDLRQPAADGQAADDIDVGHVVFAAAVGSLVGWALLAALERITSRAYVIWRAVAALALLASLGGPLSGSGITTANRLVLVLMHLVVAAVVIAVMYRTSRATALSARSSS
ncbi:MAG TPA: DUF6069 family protein [Solirubrobacteraceae bacterium]|nr:DUF6069 family protein [Solirubrobacteraceae bacterium]